MQLTVKGKHLDVGESLRAHVEEQLTQTAQKYFRNPIEATVIFSKEKEHLFSVDVSIHVGSGIILQTHHEGSDPYPAFDIAAKLVAKRLSRYKDKLRDHHKYEPKGLAATYTTFNKEDEENEAEGGTEPAVIAEMETSIQMLAVSDAVMRLELGDLPALLFKNPSHGRINMVYRRKDGNIGWVDPLNQEILKAAVAPKAKKKIAPKKKPAAKKAEPKKTAAKKATPKKKEAVKKPVAKKPVKKKAVSKKVTDKKVTPKKKVTAKKPTAKKPVKKAVSKKTVAKKTAPKKTVKKSPKKK